MKYKYLSIPLVVMLSGCGNDIDAIKSGVLESNKTTTIGQAFNNWQSCQKTSWESFKTDNGTRVVEFTCDQKIKPYFDKINNFLLANKQIKDPKTVDLTSLKQTFQFTLNKDDTFQIQNISSQITWSDGRILRDNINDYSIIDSIYKNEMSFNPNDLNGNNIPLIASMFFQLYSLSR